MSKKPSERISEIYTNDMIFDGGRAWIGAIKKYLDEEWEKVGKAMIDKKQEWTKEPWKHDMDSATVMGGSNGQIPILDVIDDDAGDRAVQCVNAMEGVKDPSALVQAAGKAREALQNIIKFSEYDESEAEEALSELDEVLK